MSKSVNKKNKKSVNPAKNAVIENKALHTNNSHLKTDTKKSADPFDLDKNRLKNWKLRRELKKSINNDTKTASVQKKKNNSSKIEVKPQNKENENSRTETNETDIDESTVEDSIEQDYAPEKVELFKQKIHSKVGKMLKRFSVIPALKSILVFWWLRLKELNITQVVFILVSAVIIFAFIVPPLWSAIDFYRSGLWRIFG